MLVVLFAFVVLVIVLVVVAAVVLVAIIVATIILAVVPLFGVMVGSVWSPACVMFYGNAFHFCCSTYAFNSVLVADMSMVMFLTDRAEWFHHTWNLVISCPLF